MERDNKRAELTVSDQSQLGELRDFLSLAIPGIHVSQIAGQPAPGEQGVLDFLEVLASSSTIVAIVKTLPEFIRSRRTALSVTITTKGKSITVTATNINDVLPVLEQTRDA